MNARKFRNELLQAQLEAFKVHLHPFFKVFSMQKVVSI